MPLQPGIVDVKCVDEAGRLFIVEKQMQWTSAFLKRGVFNASHADVKQLERGETYEILKPVIALSILDDISFTETSEFFHHFQIVSAGQPAHRIEDLEFVFIELPKFREQ